MDLKVRGHRKSSLDGIFAFVPPLCGAKIALGVSVYMLSPSSLPGPPPLSLIRYPPDTLFMLDIFFLKFSGASLRF